MFCLIYRTRGGVKKKHDTASFATSFADWFLQTYAPPLDTRREGGTGLPLFFRATEGCGNQSGKQTYSCTNIPNWRAEWAKMQLMTFQKTRQKPAEIYNINKKTL